MSADKKMRVLLIDDSHFSLSQCSRALGDEYEISTSNSGAEGLMKMEKEHFDLVVTDLLMPQISGLALLGQVRHRHPEIMVIVCSADVQETTSRKAKELGAAAFVSKPIDPEEFRRVVRLVLAHKKAPRDLPIDPKYADAFREIFNIGVGRAADSLSKLVYDTVKLSVPELKILRPAELAGHVAENFKDDVACVKQKFGGVADGMAYLLLSAKSGMNLVNALVKQDKDETVSFSDADQEMLVEVGNILINSLVGTLSNTLGIDLDFGQAVCMILHADKVTAQLQLENIDYVLYIETLFVVPGRQIGGSLVIIMGSKGMGTILKGIDRLL